MKNHDAQTLNNGLCNYLQRKVALYEHRYKHGKILEPITPEQFEAALQHPYNSKLKHRAFIVLLYLTGVRISELLRATKESFQLTDNTLYWEVGRRLKHGKRTPPLPLSLGQPHFELLTEQIKRTRKGNRVFGFDRTTAWRHCAKSGLGYNHHARLTAITFFLSAKNEYGAKIFSIAEIVNWFGITVETVNEYVGLVALKEMGAVRR